MSVAELAKSFMKLLDLFGDLFANLFGDTAHRLERLLRFPPDSHHKAVRQGELRLIEAGSSASAGSTRSLMLSANAPKGSRFHPFRSKIGSFPHSGLGRRPSRDEGGKIILYLSFRPLTVDDYGKRADDYLTIRDSWPQ